MSDYLMRDAAPFSEAVWSQIDEMVVRVLKHNLVGRRLVSMVGPLGWGVELAPVFGFAAQDTAVATDPEYVKLTELSAEFMIKAKHLAMAEQTPWALDLGAAAIAAAKLAQDEDKVIIGGLIAKAGAAAPLGDWEQFGAAFKAVAAAVAKLRSTGYDAPFALVISPMRFATLAGSMAQGREEIKMVEELVEAGILECPGMPDDKALVVSPAAWNLDMVVGQDAVTAYVGNDGMDQKLRVFETLALRIKRAGAVCVLS